MTQAERERETWRNLFAAPTDQRQAAIDELTARRGGIPPTPEEIDLRQTVGEQLGALPGVTITVDDAADAGHQTAAAMFMDSLGDLGYPGRITVVASDTVRDQLANLIPDHIKQNVDWQPPTTRSDARPRGGRDDTTTRLDGDSLLPAGADDRAAGNGIVRQELHNTETALSALAALPPAHGDGLLLPQDVLQRVAGTLRQDELNSNLGNASHTRQTADQHSDAPSQTGSRQPARAATTGTDPHTPAPATPAPVTLEERGPGGATTITPEQLDGLRTALETHRDEQTTRIRTTGPARVTPRQAALVAEALRPSLRPDTALHATFGTPHTHATTPTPPTAPTTSTDRDGRQPTAAVTEQVDATDDELARPAPKRLRTERPRQRDPLHWAGGARDTGLDPTGLPLGHTLVVERPRSGGVVMVDPSAVTTPEENGKATGKRTQSGSWTRFELPDPDRPHAFFGYDVGDDGNIRFHDGRRTVVLPADGWIAHGDDFLHLGEEVLLRGDTGWIGRIDNWDTLRDTLNDTEPTHRVHSDGQTVHVLPQNGIASPGIRLPLIPSRVAVAAKDESFMAAAKRITEELSEEIPRFAREVGTWTEDVHAVARPYGVGTPHHAAEPLPAASHQEASGGRARGQVGPHVPRVLDRPGFEAAVRAAVALHREQGADGVGVSGDRDASRPVSLSSHELSAQECLLLLGVLRDELFPQGVAPAHAVDDSVLGVRPQESRLALGARWKSVGSWEGVETALAEGSVAFVLARRPSGKGHAVAAYRLPADRLGRRGRVVWVDLAAGGKPKISTSLPSDIVLVDTKAVIVDLAGRVVPDALPDFRPSASTAHALVDASADHQYGAIGMELEWERWGVLMPEGVQPDISYSIMMAEGDTLTISMEDWDKPTPFIETVGRPLRVLLGDQGRHAKEAFFREAMELQMRLSRSSGTVPFLDIFSRSLGFIPRPDIKEVLRETRLYPIPGRVDRITPQYTVGVPLSGLYDLLIHVRDSTPDDSPYLRQHIDNALRFGSEIAVDFASTVIEELQGLRLPLQAADLLDRVEDVRTLRGTMALVYTQVAAWAYWPALRQISVDPPLSKNLTAVISRTWLSGLLAGLSPRVQTYLADKIPYIRKLFSDYFILGLMNDGLYADEFRRVPIADFLHISIGVEGLTLGDYLESGLRNSARRLDQAEIHGMHMSFPDLDTNDGKLDIPLAVEELRFYGDDAQGFDEMTRRFDTLAKLSRELYEDAQNLRDSSQSQRSSRQVQILAELARSDDASASALMSFLHGAASLDAALPHAMSDGLLLPTASVQTVARGVIDAMRVTAFNMPHAGALPAIEAAVHHIGGLISYLDSLPMASLSGEQRRLLADVKQTATMLCSTLDHVLADADVRHNAGTSASARDKGKGRTADVESQTETAHGSVLSTNHEPLQNGRRSGDVRGYEQARPGGLGRHLGAQAPVSVHDAWDAFADRDPQAANDLLTFTRSLIRKQAAGYGDSDDAVKRAYAALAPTELNRPLPAQAEALANQVIAGYRYLMPGGVDGNLSHLGDQAFNSGEQDAASVGPSHGDSNSDGDSLFGGSPGPSRQVSPVPGPDHADRAQAPFGLALPGGDQYWLPALPGGILPPAPGGHAAMPRPTPFDVDSYIIPRSSTDARGVLNGEADLLWHMPNRPEMPWARATTDLAQLTSEDAKAVLAVVGAHSRATFGMVWDHVYQTLGIRLTAGNLHRLHHRSRQDLGTGAGYEGMARTAEETGLTTSQVPADGDCLLHSLAHLTTTPGQPPPSPDDVRNTLADHFAQHRDGDLQHLTEAIINAHANDLADVVIRRDNYPDELHTHLANQYAAFYRHSPTDTQELLTLFTQALRSPGHYDRVVGDVTPYIAAHHYHVNLSILETTTGHIHTIDTPGTTRTWHLVRSDYHRHWLPAHPNAPTNPRHDQHIQNLREHGLASGLPLQTRNWLTNVRCGNTAISPTHLQQLRDLHVPNLEKVQPREDSAPLTHDQHIQNLREHGLASDLPPQTRRWLTRVRSGRTTVSEVHRQQLRDLHVPNLDNVRTRE
ncbi:hypothetical protein, partial [Streptomyces sp. NPDC007856]|uniref:hypothetical protein n=1 Tax=Streptomyces sp. NPDC007856 TaxID=3364781 RepID=UPI003694B4DC